MEDARTRSRFGRALRVRQLAREIRTLAPWYLGVAALLVIAWLLGLIVDVKMSDILRDAPNTVGYHPLIGAVSQLGATGWLVAAVICLFGANLAARRARHPRRHREFLLASAAFSGILFVDDLFVVHDNWAPFILGVSETVVYAVYGILFVGYLARYHRTIAEHHPLRFILALIWLGGSLGGDLLFEPWPLTLEDGLKLIGIVTWVLYFVGYVRDAIEAHPPVALGDQAPVDSERLSTD